VETDELQRRRALIDELDDRLLALLAERAEAVAALWAWKVEHGVPERDPAREVALRQRLARRAEALGLDTAAVQRVLDAVIGQRLKR
jgi:chorismate mutase/prephenate dehydrogenase